MRHVGDPLGSFTIGRRGPGGKAGQGRTHLPGSQAAATEQVPARLHLHVLVALGTDLAELKRGVHGPVQLQLLLAGKMGMTTTSGDISHGDASQTPGNKSQTSAPALKPPLSSRPRVPVPPTCAFVMGLVLWGWSTLRAARFSQ